MLLGPTTRIGGSAVACDPSMLDRYAGGPAITRKRLSCETDDPTVIEGRYSGVTSDTFCVWFDVTLTNAHSFAVGFTDSTRIRTRSA